MIALADTIDDRYRTMTLVLGFGGLRMAEAAGLRRRHVDPLRGTVRIVDTAVEAGASSRSAYPRAALAAAPCP